MKKIQIKNRYTDEIIVEMEAESIREVVEKNRASLSGADLSGADLSWAKLSGANLYGAKIKVTQKEELLKSLSIVIEG